jgi:hypothetical protein
MLPKDRYYSTADLSLKIDREYTNALHYNDKNWRRSEESWRFYWGLDGEKGLGQWPAEAIAHMVREGRHIATYNLVRPLVDNIAGGIMKSPFSIDFSPIDTDVSSLTYAIKDLLYTDKELTDWRVHELSLVIGGLIYRGDLEMYINKEYHKDGNIGLRALLPGTMTYDPYWKTPRSKDCRKCWKTSWLTPRQMLDIYSGAEADIKMAVMFRKYGENTIKMLTEYYERMGDEYGDNQGIFPYPHDEEMWGSQYKVIEYYHMEKVSHKVEFVMTEDDHKVYLPKDLIDADPAEKIAWYNANVPGWIPDQVFEDTDTEDVQFVTTVVPSLSQTLVLANGPTQVQCGRLQFFPWSASRLNGEFGGVVDAIKDAQRTVNYWESLMTNKIQTEGGGGAQFIDPEAFETEAEYHRYIAERNNPKAVFRLKRSFLRTYPNGPAVPVHKSPFPHEAMEHLKHMIEMILPKLSKVAPANQGRSEHSGESGYLFRLKKLQADIEQYTIHEGLRCFWNEVGEAYMYQAMQTYGNGHPRRVVNPGSKKAFWINKHEKRTVDGCEVECIVNDLSRLKEFRHRVMVVESDDSPTRKVEITQVASSLLQSMPQTKILTITELAHTLAKTFDSFDEEKQAVLEEHHKLEMEAAQQQLRSGIAAGKVQELTAMIQAQQLQAQLQGAGAANPQQAAEGGMPGQPQGGAPGGPPSFPAAEVPEEIPIEGAAHQGSIGASAPEMEMSQAM